MLATVASPMLVLPYVLYVRGRASADPLCSATTASTAVAVTHCTARTSRLVASLLKVVSRSTLPSEFPRTYGLGAL